MNEIMIKNNEVLTNIHVYNNKFLKTDWDALYMLFNDYMLFNAEFEVETFGKKCTDERPLIRLLDKMKEEENVFNIIVDFFLSHYICFWYNEATKEIEPIDYESPEYYEGFENHKKLILSLATYFQNEYIKSLLRKALESKKES